MRKFSILFVVCIIFLASCGGNSSKSTISDNEKKEVIDTYANIVYQNYKDCYDASLIMQQKITNFTSNPDENTLIEAKKHWLKARDIYGQTEVFRGSNGPIDSDGEEKWAINNEGQLNAWPLDEGYIDYVKLESITYAGDYNGGIIASKVPITKEYLVGENESVNDKSISTGWHAIEFLLWGQDETDPSELKSGMRPITDYTTEKNKDRRIQYLTVVTQILVDDIKSLVDTWKPNGTYYKVFNSLPVNDALTNILSGPFFLANEELSQERMSKPADLTDGINMSGQEDEHSCFSDNSHRDVLMNAQGIENVIFGKYANIKGKSIYDLLLKVDKKTAENLKKASDKMMQSVEKIDTSAKNGKPFDVLLQEESTSNPGQILTSARAIQQLGSNISAGAISLGISVN